MKYSVILSRSGERGVGSVDLPKPPPIGSVVVTPYWVNSVGVPLYLENHWIVTQVKFDSLVVRPYATCDIEKSNSMAVT
jgi:hypothetical protein